MNNNVDVWNVALIERGKSNYSFKVYLCTTMYTVQVYSNPILMWGSPSHSSWWGSTERILPYCQPCSQPASPEKHLWATQIHWALASELVLSQIYCCISKVYNFFLLATWQYFWSRPHFWMYLQKGKFNVFHMSISAVFEPFDCCYLMEMRVC